MAVRAKFVCGQVTKYDTEDKRVDVKLTAVAGGEENKQWARYTPIGALLMTIENPAAARQFIPGKEFFLDITPADGESRSDDGDPGRETRNRLAR